MKPKYFSIIGAAALLAAASPLLYPTTAHALSTEVQPKEDDVQILTRGPVHEAFAEAVTSKPEPGYIVSKAPPSLIEELPPEQQLEGDNVTWISGYWAWDDDTNDFLWISGVWRNIPPGRQWVPGYWSDLKDGRWQWVSGYWADTAVADVEYVGESPPQSLDAGPNTAAPDEDSTWVPGNWRYAETRYVWSPGYWNALRPDWTWVPSRWCWAPSGYYYVDGYWDYAIANRGVLFAPAYFRSPVWADPGYCYTPSVVVSLGVFDNHCWYRPNYCHYYFGDYYGPRYSDLGFFVSYGWHGRRGCYDPIWAYNYWDHRHDIGWRNRVADRYNFFRDNADARPFRTWAGMRDFRNDRFSDDPRSRSRLFASTLNGFARNPVRGERFRQLTAANRDQLVAQRQQMREFTQNRRQMESARLRPNNNIAGGANANNRMTVLRENMRRSPVSGRDVSQIAQNQAPPRRPLAAGNSARVRPEAVVRPNAATGRDIAQRMQQSMRPGAGNGAAAQANRNNIAGRQNLNPQANRNNIAGRQNLNPLANRNNIAGRQNLNSQPNRNRTQPNIGGTAQRESQAANAQRRQQQALQQRQAQRSPQVAQQRQQVRPQQNSIGRTRPQLGNPQRQIQQRQQQQVRPQQRVAPQQRQSIQRPQIQRAAPQQRQQARPQFQQQARPQQRVMPQRQSAPRMQSQYSRPSSSVQRQSISRPQVQRAAPKRQSVSRPQVSRSSSTQRQSSQQRGKSR
ncbi:YXWGXW repeat-containing protein [Haloferula sp. BvORR071]|uniref:YXWGXW repeat-containing protein n=1 Tax=Haloferula sp. BvORR071 TaxID=1396141 RepID=UPI000695F161|nr:YXWGXW repeat-containing protein [Haloferula sp. BvORR071]